MPVAIDHVIVCVPDLDSAASELADRHGLASIEGGRHTGQGTANRLIPLGTTYIELLTVVSPREAKTSVLGTWAMHRAAVPGADALCLRTDDIEAVAAARDLQTSAMDRVTPDGVVLSWRMAGLKQMMSAGLPFFIQWDIPDDLHPGLSPVDHPSGPRRLASVTLRGEPERLREWAGDVPGLRFEAGEPSIEYELSTADPVL